MFLAIAVDNLANAQELTAAEQEQEEEEAVSWLHGVILILILLARRQMVVDGWFIDFTLLVCAGMSSYHS